MRKLLAIIICKLLRVVGKAVGKGTHEELLASNEIYSEVYESQTKNGGDFDEKAGE